MVWILKRNDKEHGGRFQILMVSQGNTIVQSSFCVLFFILVGPKNCTVDFNIFCWPYSWFTTIHIRNVITGLNFAYSNWENYFRLIAICLRGITGEKMGMESGGFISRQAKFL